MVETTLFLTYLRSLVREVHSRSFEQALAKMESEHWPDGQDGYNEIKTTRWKKKLIVAVEGLGNTLPDKYIGDEIEHEYNERDWPLGSEFEVLAPQKILRGFVIPVRSVPIIEQITLKAFAFLKINNCKDILDRHLEQGIHYHYALADKRHTTTMICWDTRWMPSSTSGQKIRPLFHEIHAKGAKSIKARPENWGNKKRASIREACKPDLSNWTIDEFRCASNKSTPVWPTNATLTPRPLTPAKPKRGKRA